MDKLRNLSPAELKAVGDYVIKNIENKQIGYAVRAAINANFYNLGKDVASRATKEDVERLKLRYYETEAALKADQPSPNIGDRALVGAPHPGTVWGCKTLGIWYDTGVAPSPEELDLAEYAKSGGSDKTLKQVDEEKADIKQLNHNAVPFSLLNSFYHKDTGALIAAPNSLFRCTAKVKVVAGMTFSLQFRGLGLSAQAVFFDENGTFLNSIVSLDSIVIPEGVDEVAFNTNIADDIIIAPYSIVFEELRPKVEKNTNAITSTNVNLEKINPKLDRLITSASDSLILPFSNANSYYHKDTGALIAAPNTLFRCTAKVKVVAGMTFSLQFKGIGLSAQAVFFDENGAFTHPAIYQDFVIVPNGVDSVAFNTNIPDDVIIAPYSFLLGASGSAGAGSVFGWVNPQSNIAEMYKCANIGAVDSTLGILINSDTVQSDSNYFVTSYLPIKAGVTYVYEGFLTGTLHCHIYTQNKKSILQSFSQAILGSSGAVSKFEFIAPDGSEFIRLSARTAVSLTPKTESYIIMPYVPVVNKLEQNPHSLSYFINEVGRVQIRFRLNGDFNVDGKEAILLTDNLLNGLKVKIRGGKTEEFTYIYDGKNSCNCQEPRPTIKVAIKGGFKPEYTYDFNTSNSQTFLGEKLFSLRFIGAESAENKDLTIDVTNGILSIKNATIVVKQYTLANYTTVHELCEVISTDIGNNALTDFEVLYHDIAHKPISDIASFEPVKLLAYFPVVNNGINYMSFPIAVRAVDKKIHVLEIIRRENNDGDNAWVVLDGMITKLNYGLNIPSVNTIATLNNDEKANVLSFEAKNGERQMSFPIVKHFYAHGIKDNFDESVTADTNLGYLADFADEMQKRGAASITMQELSDYLRNGKQLPRLCYILNFDDSRYEMFENPTIRRFFQKRGIKPHTSNVLAIDDGRVEFFVATETTFEGVPVIGQTFRSTPISATYLGKSLFTGKHIFKFRGVRDNDGLFPRLLTCVEDASIKATIGKDMSIVSQDEILWSRYTRKPNNASSALEPYGFNLHLHDLRHQEALPTFNYVEFKQYVEDGIEKFRHYFGVEPAFYVYPYGYITPMHADIIGDMGFRLGFTSAPSWYNIATVNHNIMLLPRQSIDSNTNMKLIGDDLDQYV